MDKELHIIEEVNLSFKDLENAKNDHFEDLN